MKKLFALILAFSILSFNVHAQKENNFWFFGDQVGLDFNTAPPTSITGSLNTFEGCASISDPSGKLLFYTDGTTIYNRQGLVMVNGTGLFGSTSSTSSALIVPDPCSETSYYVFTTDDVTGSRGVNYTIVEMDDNTDCFYDPTTELGRVVLKNQRLSGPNGEKICALKKSNGVDYWILSTFNGAAGFYVHELTSTGISLHSVQGTGPTIEVYGYLKASKTGKLLAAASSDGSKDYVLIYSFDNQTGIVLHQTTINPNRDLVYGIEFSDNEQYLYYTCNSVQPAPSNAKDVFSYNLVSGVNSLLHTSPNIPVVIPNNTYANLGALQMGPDGRIYVAKGRTSFLDVIDQPNGGGVYLVDNVSLSGTSYVGLPTIVSGKVSACQPLDMKAYRFAAPTLFTQSIKNELMTDGFSGLDKEYDDLDNDGDIDMLFTKNNQLFVIKNSAGHCNTPSFSLPSISLGINLESYSYRLFDWDKDGDKDLIISGKDAIGVVGIWISINSGAGNFSSNPVLLHTGYSFNNNQLIEVGDLNNDGTPDLLVSDQSSFLGINGTHYFENDGSGQFQFNATLIADNGGSYHCPELYDADCKNGMDLLISDPLDGPLLVSGRMYFHENLGGGATLNTLPNISPIGIPNQFGFLDVPQNVNDDLFCDWIITRIVDFYNDGCPIAIVYNPCKNEIYFYDSQNCICSNRDNTTGVIPSRKSFSSDIKIYPNPARNKLNIQSQKENGIINNIEIQSINGTFLKNIPSQQSEIDLSLFDNGIYLLKIQIDKRQIVKKFIVQ